MTGDREKSIAAGMNDHLTKPVQTENLLRLIEKLPVRELRGVSSPLSDAYRNEDQQSMHKNFDRLFHELQEDLAFMEKMAHEFKTSSEIQLADLKIAAAKGDAGQFRFNAHKLKGSLAVLRAEKAGRMAAELEMMGQSQKLAGAAELLQQFEKEIGLVTKNLFSYIMYTNR